ncbi:BON domain-containing protein [Sulfitobacter sp. 1A12126]|uniref:BON domain-containing protein n=1 Tax=Sulfitobacter sp. 1A12126 TaxID=3368591 RepID=UPI003746CE4B
MANRQYDENHHHESVRSQYQRGPSDWNDQRGPQRGQRQDRGQESYDTYSEDARSNRQDREYDRSMRDERGAGYIDAAPDNDLRDRGGYGSQPGQDNRQGGEHYGAYGRGSHREGFGLEMGRQTQGRDYGYRGGWQNQTSWGQRDGQAKQFGDEGQDGYGQSHRGRGPKNYQRSDDRISEEVCDRLSDDHDVDASDIEVSVSDREVTLSGEVDSKQAKRCAEDCADSVSGIEHVQNNLRVRKSGSGEQPNQDRKTKNKA